MKKIIFWFSGCILLLMVVACSPRGLVLESSEMERWGAGDMNISDLYGDMNETNSTFDESGKFARIDFPVDEYKGLKRIGKGTIKGKIYITDSYGDKVLGKGTRLYLNPVTSYSTQWYEESYLEGAKMEKADPRLFNYLKFTAANQEGKFAFYGVPSGRYYLIGTVQCGTNCGYASVKNIRIATEVDVYGKEVKEKDLTKVIE